MTKTKKCIVIGIMALMVLPFFDASAKNNGNGNNGNHGNSSNHGKAHKKKIVINNAVITGTPTATTLTVTRGTTNYTIDITNAKLVRRYNAKADISEIMSGDYVMIWGTIPDTSNPNQITATQVRDNSIQKLGASFQGTIKSLDSTTTPKTFILQSNHRGDQKVNVYDTTSIKYQNQVKTFADLAAGDSVMVKGIWNSTHSVIYNTTEIKIKTLLTPAPPAE